MLDIILKAFYLMIPAYFANMSPVLFRKVNFLDYPVDFNKKFRGNPILGSHKTFRGFFFGTLIGILVCYLQYLLYSNGYLRDVALVDYSNWLLLGFLLGFGALFGDSVKSFFKRRFDVNPGKRFIPWDQLDYSVGSIAFMSFLFLPSLKIIITILVMNFFLHILANRLGYYLKINDVKW